MKLKLLAEMEILGTPKMVNQIGKAHWAVISKERKKWRRETFDRCLIDGIVGAQLKRAALEFTRFSTREPDFDNLVSSFKSVLDGLKDAAVILDDRPSVIGSPTFLWKKYVGKGGKIGIRVWAIIEEEDVSLGQNTPEPSPPPAPTGLPVKEPDPIPVKTLDLERHLPVEKIVAIDPDEAPEVVQPESDEVDLLQSRALFSDKPLSVGPLTRRKRSPL